MRSPQRAHCYFCIIQPVLALIRAGCHTLEVHLVKTASTRDTISKEGDGNNAELMESRGPKVTVMVKERYFSRNYFSNTRPL